MITCDDALYTLREQISSKKEDIKVDDMSRVRSNANVTRFKKNYISMLMCSFVSVFLEKSGDNAVGAVHFHA